MAEDIEDVLGTMKRRQYTVREIADALSADLAGDPSVTIDGLAEPRHAGPGKLAVALQDIYLTDLQNGRARAAIVAHKCQLEEFGLAAVIIARPDRQVLAQLTRLFEETGDCETETSIHDSAVIASDAEIGEGCAIGAHSVIGSAVRIGAGSQIGANVSIGESTIIGIGARIMSGVQIGWGAQIGDRFIAQSNAVIGSAGFSYAVEASPEIAAASLARHVANERIASLGIVKIGNDVEIGACTTIDRGTLAATVIGDGSKLDNQVHIAHNVKIGKNCIICGHVGIAGSAVLEDHVTLGGMAGVGNHVSVAAGITAAGASKIYTNQTRKGAFLMGSPAIEFSKYMSIYRILRRLPRLARKIDELLVQPRK